MDFALADEHLAVQDTIDQVLAPWLADEAALRRRLHADKDFPPELWEALCDVGLLGCLLPEELGGNGMGMLPLALAVERMTSHGVGNALLILTAMAEACILRHGSDELKGRLLPEMAAGRMVCCFALTEPDAGSNAFRLRTVARLDGDVYRVTGDKVFITGVDRSDRMLLVVRTTPREVIEEKGLPKAFGLGLLVVDPRSPGITLSPIPTRGIEGQTQFEVHLQDVAVPASDLVGMPDMGAAALFDTLNPERILAAASACGMAEHLLRKSVAYARERKVFRERPIGAYQAVAHPLARVHVELESARLLTRRAAWSFDRGDDPATTGGYCNAAKIKSSEMVNEAVDRAIQTHGGYGFSEEYGIIQAMETARLLKTAPIANELVLNFIAEHQLGLPRSY